MHVAFRRTERGYDTGSDVDALFAGGAQDVIPGMAVLRVNPAGDEVVAYYGMPNPESREDRCCIRRHRTASAHRMAVGLRIVVDPQPVWGRATL